MTSIALAAREAVDAALAAGKFRSDRRDHYLALYLSDPAGTQALLDALYALPELRTSADLYDALYPAPVRVADAPAEPEYVALYGAP